MSFVPFLHLLGELIFSFAFLVSGTFFLLFAERFISARSQHREGPGRSGEIDFYQVIRDFLKVRERGGASGELVFRFRMIFELWRVLPFVFVWVLVSAQVPFLLRSSELLFLIFLIVISAVIEAILINATEDQVEKYNLKQVLFLRLIGATILLICAMSLSAAAGNFALKSISELQGGFPFLSILSSPGMFIGGIVSFCSIFLITATGPVRQQEDISLLGSWHYSFFFVRRMWIFCLVSLWTMVFLGGTSGILMKGLFLLKILFSFSLYFILQISQPQVRVADAESLAIRWLLPLSVLGFLLELVWMGVFQ